MSDGDRGNRPSVVEAFLIFLALFGAAFALYYIGHVSGVNAGRNQSYAATEQQNARESVRVNCADLQGSDFAQCAVENVEAAYEEGAAQQDLYAQQDMAKWALAMVFVAGLTAGITLWALIYIRGTLNETRRMAGEATAGTKAMKRQNRLAVDAQRAWVTLGIQPQIVRRVALGRLLFRVDFAATNIGQTVARNFELRTEAFFKGQDEGHDDFLDRIHAVLEHWRSEHDQPGDASLVPQDTETESFEGEQNSTTLRWWGGNGWPVRATQPLFLAAAFYRTVSEPSVLHVSWRTWYLGHRSDAGLFRPLLFESDEVCEPPRLCVSAFHTTLMHEEYPANDDNSHQPEG